MIGSQPARTCRKEGDYISVCVLAQAMRIAHGLVFTWPGLVFFPSCSTTMVGAEAFPEPGTFRRRRSASCVAPVLVAESMSATKPSGLKGEEGVGDWNSDRSVDGQWSEVDRSG